MDQTQIVRPRRRSSLLPLTCGCLSVFALLSAVLVVALLFFLPQIGARLAGMVPEGDTAQVFVATPQPTVQLQDPTEPAQVTVNLGDYSPQTFNNDNPQLYSFTTGASTTGEALAVATFTEAGLNDLCRQRTTICSANSSDPRFRNGRIDLRPGGAVVYADVAIPQLGGFEQTVGIVLRWDAAARRVVAAGIDYGGTLYSPSQQAFSDIVSQIEQSANNVIQQLSVSAGNSVYTLAEVRTDDTTLTLILR